MNLSMMTAVLPSLCRFFSELQMGRGTRLGGAHHYENYDSGDGPYPLSDLSHIKREDFVGGTLPTVTNRISAGRASENSAGDSDTLHTGGGRENLDGGGNSQRQRPPPHGVLQTWEISYEVERDDDEDAAGPSNDSQTALRPP
jgi:hypothetical protein